MEEVGSVLGLMGFFFAIITFMRIEKLEKQLKKGGLLK